MLPLPFSRPPLPGSPEELCMTGCCGAAAPADFGSPLWFGSWWLFQLRERISSVGCNWGRGQETDPAWPPPCPGIVDKKPPLWGVFASCDTTEATYFVVYFEKDIITPIPAALASRGLCSNLADSPSSPRSSEQDLPHGWAQFYVGAALRI